MDEMNGRVGAGLAPAPHRGRAWWIAGGLLAGLALFAICATIAGLLMEHRLKAYALLTAIGYTLSALGFLSLAGWAFVRGHFRDVEAVKDKVLEAERT